MKYTKEQLLGRIFRWSHDYVVVENGKDVMIECLSDGSLHRSYTVDYLNNECLKYLLPLEELHYEIY